MTQTWDSGELPVMPKMTILSWVRVVLRASALIVLVFGGLALLLIVRLVERPMHGQNRPWTPYITQAVCRCAFIIMGMGFHVRGTPMDARGAVVANHTSWLDIFALNAAKRIYFVSKSEVAGWPGIGWLARATGTVFIERNRAKAQMQTQVFETRLLAGHKLLFFPEGTSTDGQQVLPFKATLFQAFFEPRLRDVISVQPVTVTYTAPPNTDPRFYGWWGDMSFGAHLITTLAPARQGFVTITYHVPHKVADFANRKALASACEQAVRAAHSQSLHQAKSA
jgi:1-acyl-sn-glycerol-3-phosphate acyltransferase